MHTTAALGHGIEFVAELEADEVRVMVENTVGSLNWRAVCGCVDFAAIHRSGLDWTPGSRGYRPALDRPDPHSRRGTFRRRGLRQRISEYFGSLQFRSDQTIRIGRNRSALEPAQETERRRCALLN